MLCLRPVCKGQHWRSIIKYIFCIFDVNFEDNLNFEDSLKGSPRDLRMDYSRGNVNRIG